MSASFKNVHRFSPFLPRLHPRRKNKNLQIYQISYFHKHLKHYRFWILLTKRKQIPSMLLEQRNHRHRHSTILWYPIRSWLQLHKHLSIVRTFCHNIFLLLFSSLRFPASMLHKYCCRHFPNFPMPRCPRHQLLLHGTLQMEHRRPSLLWWLFWSLWFGRPERKGFPARESFDANLWVILLVLSRICFSG